jgi:hypothetical protein
VAATSANPFRGRVPVRRADGGSASDTHTPVSVRGRLSGEGSRPPISPETRVCERSALRPPSEIPLRWDRARHHRRIRRLRHPDRNRRPPWHARDLLQLAPAAARPAGAVGRAFRLPSCGRDSCPDPAGRTLSEIHPACRTPSLDQSHFRSPAADIPIPGHTPISRRPGAHADDPSPRGACRRPSNMHPSLRDCRPDSERGDRSEDPPPRSSPRFGTARVRGTPRSPMTLRVYRFTLRARRVKQIRKFHILLPLPAGNAPRQRTRKPGRSKPEPGARKPGRSKPEPGA